VDVGCDVISEAGKANDLTCGALVDGETFHDFCKSRCYLSPG
jgi:hypothetical protein